MSISTDGSVSVLPARRVRRVPAAGRIDTTSRDGELRELLEASMSISTDGSVSVRPARRVRPVPAAGRIDTASRDSGLPAREQPSIRSTRKGGSHSSTRRQLTSGVVARSSARASGAAPAAVLA
jgi:hypothetical protein